MERTNTKHKLEWEETINQMSRDELQFIIEHPEGYYPTFLKMAKAKLEELSSLPEHEAMKIVVKKILEELGCPCNINKDGELDFYFQGSHFFIFLNEDNHYMVIWEYSWESVSLDNTIEVERLKHSINEANNKCTVTTVYNIDEEERTMEVSTTTSILYRPMIFNLKIYLQTRLHNFFYAHDLVHAETVLLKEREEQNIIKSYDVTNYN